MVARCSLLIGICALGACSSGGDADRAAGEAVSTSVAATSTTIEPAPAMTTAPTSVPATTAAPMTPVPTTAAPTSLAPTSAPATTAAPTTAAPTTAAPTTTTAPTSSVPALQPFSLPVGPDGVTYLEQAEGFIEGPNTIAIDSSGGVHIGNQLAGEIVSVRGATISRIDVAALGLLWITDIIAADDHLVVLEEFTAGPVRQLVHRIGFDGTLLETIDLGLDPNDPITLWGLVETSDGRIVQEHSDSYRTWNPATQMFEVGPLVIRDRIVETVPAGITIGPTFIPHDATAENEFWASLRFLSAPTDDLWVLTRWDGRQTVEWWTGDGTFVGAAEVPLDGVTDGKNNIVAVSSDGRAFALYTTLDEARVIELDRQPERIINGS